MPGVIFRQSYGYRAVALLRDGDRVLLQRGIGDGFWALPGGGVEVGESARTTVRRELLEELGQEVRVGRPIALIENTFSLGGTRQQQIELYFEASAVAGSLVREDPLGAVRSREAHLEFRLFSASECRDLDIRPVAARKLLFAKNEAFRYVGRAPAPNR